MENGASAEIAVVGNEGIVGISLFMGGESTPSRAVVQSAGQGFAAEGTGDQGRVQPGRPVLHLLLRYTQALITQMAQTAVCNRHHSLDQQLCRWLLLSLDRLQGNELVMTQELIANMLGVRREGVTEGALKLQKAGLIRYARGRITVLDRRGLEKRTCECYAVVKKEYDRLLPERWRADQPAGLCAGRQSPRRGAQTGKLGPGRHHLGVRHTACTVENHLIELLPRNDRRELAGPLRAGRTGAGRGPVRARRADPACLLSRSTASFRWSRRSTASRALEVGMVGREGMLGAQLALGVATMPLACGGAGPGRGMAHRRRGFPARTGAQRGAAARLNRYIYVLMSQLADSAACLRFHLIGPRLARWLLMSQDRAHSDSFHVTHEFLAHMLGVRRVGITAAAGALQRNGLIEYHRGVSDGARSRRARGVACGRAMPPTGVRYAQQFR